MTAAHPYSINLEDRSLATRVILVRHGESTYNLQGRVQGHYDESTLTETGRATARQVGMALGNIQFAAIYTSPLQRARATAEEIVTGLGSGEAAHLSPAPNIETADGLIEISLPLWEGMHFDEVRQKFPEGYRYWREAPHQLQMEVPGPKGSTLFSPVLALFEQAQAFWQQTLSRHTDGTILLVGHSGITRALIMTAIGLPPERYHLFQASNCSISVLNFPRGWGQPAQVESLNLTAHLGVPLPQPKADYQGVRLLLVRHGETEWNRQGRFQGGIDVPLNETGRHQAEQVAEFLKAVPIDFAVSSPMSRPKETAELILQHHSAVSLELTEGLREISHGAWEGKLEAEIEQQYPGELQRWREYPAEVQMPGGENLHQVWERAVVDWDRIVQRADSAQLKIGLVVGHDATNKVILCHITGAGAEEFWNFKQGNGAITIIDYPPGGGSPLLYAMNITTHLGGGILDRTAAGAL